MSHATSTTPSIRIYDSARLHNHNQNWNAAISRNPSHPSGQSAPMAIPNSREPVPPPLPPPRYISDHDQRLDTAWQFANSPNSNAFGGQSHGSVKPGSSLLGGAAVLLSREKPDSTPDYAQSRRRSTLSRSSDIEMLDDDDSTRPSTANYSLQSERQLGQKSLQTSSHAYDKQLLSKIGGPNAPAGVAKRNGQLPPLAMPDRSSNNSNSLTSPVSRWPQSGTVSPGGGGFKSPTFDPALSERDGTQTRRFGSMSTDGGFGGTRQQRVGSYDQNTVFTDFAMDEKGVRDLSMNDGSPGSDEYQAGPKAGVKRAALSPPIEAAREDRPTGSGTDLYHRRSQQMLVNRNAPASRFQAGQPGSVSSASSLGQRTNSYASSYGISLASSATSYSSERLSPGALSPGGRGSGSADGELGPAASPYSANQSLNPSPRGSLSLSKAAPLPVPAPAAHQRGFSSSQAASASASADSMTANVNDPAHQQQPAAHHSRNMSQDSLVQHSRHNSASKVQGHFICECCPKKPKKFGNEEELRTHELEKQYTCAYCPNRFKNKNEAERHQNSLHLRKHSWSCAALAGVHAAYHASTVHAGADVCGYCGEEFPNPANWDTRNEHLNHVHKFGECNQAKKFFRADHFRQHLKHSHAGTSGKWTNQLENACQKDEPLPKERLPSSNAPNSPQTTARGAASLMNSIIDEHQNES